LEFPAEPVDNGRREGVGDPAGGVVNQHVDRSEFLLGEVEQPDRGGGIGQVGLHRHGTPTACPDLLDHRGGVSRTAVAVSPRHPRVGLVLDPQERTQHPTTTPRELDRARRADPVIGAGHDRGMAIARHRLVAPPARRILGAVA